MKVKFVRVWRRRSPGDVAEVTPGVADVLVRRKIAVALAAPEPPAPKRSRR